MPPRLCSAILDLSPPRHYSTDPSQSANFLDAKAEVCAKKHELPYGGASWRTATIPTGANTSATAWRWPLGSASDCGLARGSIGDTAGRHGAFSSVCFLVWRAECTCSLEMALPPIRTDALADN